MNLSNIPAIRQQFQPLHDRIKLAWKEADPHSPHSMEKWTAEFASARAEEVILCMKYFGHDLYIDGEFLEPLQVLGWIEHFLKEDACQK